MLDSTTKKNIDDCRDVLVGKVPDPKSQIEQITLALIYKFMYDMDTEAVEKFKGKAKFFAPPKYTGNKEEDEKLIDYSQYTWDKLFNPALSGAQMLALYSDALDKLQVNPNMPELFRNIFKNAYLPYRDPATLKLFLKYINLFNYSHSEKLGDAFEYLLSVMGSQGDAGQFRTPRHIIDFVTACVNPQKNETILDPACGTAGFLLSAYKHILLQNTKENVNKENIYNYNNSKSATTFAKLGGTLTPDQRKKLATQFMGYDISPDMVRLSLANMYLHGFTTPQINEYDTLSDEDRWQETFDVILANPPFMTPKGGIRPHKKFGVQANKAEILFTDYIAEHLNNKGRAGIIVPNGIIATNQTGYIQLRKMLLNDSLLAVISLPAGIFQPYSNVKTSVLILDKYLAKRSKQILFLKIQNDGFDLGVQRNEHDKNDLPLALQTLEVYKNCLINEKSYNEFPDFASIIEKENILNNKDFSLIPERYIENPISQTAFELITLNEICEFKRGPFGGSLKKEIFVSEGYLVYEQYHAINDDFTFGRYFINEVKFQEMIGFEIKPFDLIISCSGTMGKIAIVPEYARKGIINQALLKLTLNQNKILPLYLKKILETDQIQERYFRNQEGAAIQNVASVKILKDISIPLPPIEIQQQIVKEIEAYQKIIDGAKQIVNNYKPTISIMPDWEKVKLDKVCNINSQAANPLKLFNGRTFIYIDIEAVENKTGIVSYNKEINPKDAPSRARRVVNEGDIVLSTVRPNLRAFGLLENLPKRCLASTGFAVLSSKDNVLNKFLFYSIHQDYMVEQMILKSDKGQYPSITSSDVADLNIYIPSLEEQQTIVKAIEEEMQLVASNKKLIELFEQKIKNKISQVWGVKKEGVVYAENNEVTLAAEG